MLNALYRLFASSTMWSAIVLPAVSVIGSHYGIDIPPSATAGGILAVGIKEAARRYSEKH